MNRFKSIVLLLPGLFCLHQSATAAEIRLPESVTITGETSIKQLERQIHEAEDRMFGLFNQNNDDEMFNIHCHWIKPAGTRIRQRQCRPVFYDALVAEDANAFLAMTRGEAGGDLNRGGAARLIKFYNVLKEKMQAMATEHPQFLEAMEDYQGLREELRERTYIDFGRK